MLIKRFLAIRCRRLLIVCCLLSVGVLGVVLGTGLLRIVPNYDFQGFYLLKGGDDRSLIFADSVYLGEESRLIAGIDLPGFNLLARKFEVADDRLKVEWNEAEGRGILRNRLADGTVLVTNFSRYLSGSGRYPQGLFIGGAPAELLNRAGDGRELNGSGMAWFNGTGWNHLWCNTNEGIISSASGRRYTPAVWTFLGSSVNRLSDDSVVLTSRHQVQVDAVPLLIERQVTASPGEPYIRLRMTITNLGGIPGHYYYYYGDEPWIGDFGGARGDIGWTAAGLVKHETMVDPRTTSHIGMVDYGNDAIGEGRHFRMVANFIEWSADTPPDIAFFANRSEGIAHAAETRAPLRGDERSLGMYWGPRTLAAAGTQTIDLVIGMATPATGMSLPHKPELQLKTAARLPAFHPHG